MRRLKVRFSGHVQGVGFRFTVVELAHRIEVSGWVQNLPDGDVELVAEGPEMNLLGLLDALHASRLSRYTMREQVDWMEATGSFTGFEIRYA